MEDGIAQDARLDIQDAALFSIGLRLQQEGYRFTTVTPDTHALVNARPGNRYARSLVDIFGWNRPFRSSDLPIVLLNDLITSGACEQLDDGWLRARIRFSTLGDLLVLHGGFPTTDHDAVFFGPDTYRFCRLLCDIVPPGGALLEIGAGSGAASLSLKDRFQRLVMTDINPTAVRWAQVNARLACCAHAENTQGDLIGMISGRFDAIIANPPYLIDPAHRLYRDGGHLGIDVALRMVEAGIPLLAPGGRLVLYTGSPVIDGKDILLASLPPLLQKYKLPYSYEELEVDIFGSELSSRAYAEVERIAVVACVVCDHSGLGMESFP